MRQAMREADRCFTCRIAFVETARAVGLASNLTGVQAIRNEWPAFGVVEVDQALVEAAASLAIKRSLRSLDSLHLAAALMLPVPDLVVATWDGHLHDAARAEGLRLLPTTL